MSVLIATRQKLGPYLVLETIGSGGFGSVYKAKNTKTGEIVALKVPHHQSRSPDYLAHEPSVLSRLNHPNIVRFIEATKHRDIFFFVMEFVEGEPLSTRIDRDGMIPWQETVDIITQVAKAVHYAHQHRILHRDLRPANILIRKDGVVKVTDFGIAKTLHDTSYARTVIGSPPYMAPEQLEGRATFASDVYSIGVIMYECVTGTLPFYDTNFVSLRHKIMQGKCASPHELNPDVPIYLSQFILKSMHRFRSHRFKNIEEFLKALELALSYLKQREAVRKMTRKTGTYTPTRRARRKTCWNCLQPLHALATVCPHCQERQ